MNAPQTKALADLESAIQFTTSRSMAVPDNWLGGWDACLRYVRTVLADSVQERTCSDERPCIPCYIDKGECLGPARVVVHRDDLPNLGGSVGNVVYATALTTPEAEPAAALPEKWAAAYAEARDMVLNGRGPLEAVLDGDQTNAVLAVLDDAFHSLQATSSSPGAAEAGEAAALPDPVLCRFYSVDTFPELVAAMERHITRLQAKLPQDKQPAFTRVREG